MNVHRILIISSVIAVLGMAGPNEGRCADEAAPTKEAAAPAKVVPAATIVPAVKADAPAQEAPKPTSIAELQWTVPESGTADEYFKFIDSVFRPAIRPKTFEEFKELFAKQTTAITRACDKIIEKTEEPVEVIRRAVSIKSEHIARAILIFQSEDDVQNNSAIQERVDALLAIPEQLKKAGREELAKDFQETPSPFLFIAYKAKKDEESFNKLAEKLDSLVENEGKNLSSMTASMAKEALEIYRSLDEQMYASKAKKYMTLFLQASDENVVRWGKALQGEFRFFELPGKPIQLAGKLIDGTEFSYEPYKGKVVLVDFWATWCGPCVGEIPNVKKMYDAYHDKGFEVVGISCDRDKQRLEDFIKDREIPWAQMLDSDTSVEDVSLSTYYGVRGIPTMILVGKDGCVLSTKARGEALNKALEEQFGAIEVK